MRGILVILTVLWCSTLPPSYAEDAMDSQAIDRAVVEAIEQANSKLIAFQKKGDAAGMREMYTGDAVLLPGGGKNLEGKEAIEAFWAEQLGSDGVADVRLTTEDLVPLGDGLAYEIGSYTTTPRDGEPISGHYVVIWKRDEGAWKLHVDIFNDGG